ncbi:hypothetical protein C8J57DRAFT_1245176 [Mycena rebaudengoi]|nr:hypothetical protein C8J57DRAFT_1245176 [Mycena rebaudengoi]
MPVGPQVRITGLSKGAGTQCILGPSQIRKRMLRTTSWREYLHDVREIPQSINQCASKVKILYAWSLSDLRRLHFPHRHIPAGLQKFSQFHRYKALSTKNESPLLLIRECGPTSRSAYIRVYAMTELPLQGKFYIESIIKVGEGRVYMNGRMLYLNCALEPGAINLRTAKKPHGGSGGFCANSLLVRSAFTIDMLPSRTAGAIRPMYFILWMGGGASVYFWGEAKYSVRPIKAVPLIFPDLPPGVP